MRESFVRYYLSCFVAEGCADTYLAQPSEPYNTGNLAQNILSKKGNAIHVYMTPEASIRISQQLSAQYGLPATKCVDSAIQQSYAKYSFEESACKVRLRRPSADHTRQLKIQHLQPVSLENLRLEDDGAVLS